MSRLDLDTDLRELTPKLREIRRDIHRHPELGFEEHRTQRLVIKWLEGLGYQPRPCAGTGVIADLHPERASAGTIALRADLDALPIDEQTDLPHKSQHPGVSHKCGHDGHTAILLGVSALLQRHAQQIDRNVRLLFQPAEEGVDGGGARRMVAQGALDDVTEVYGLHNWPDFPKGHVRVRRGATMAQVYEFETHIKGKGGHGSQPQACRDPIVAGAALVNSLQTLVSRSIGSGDNAVVSVGAFNAGEANNVIPPEAWLRGTIRCFDAQVGARIAKRFEEICQGIALAHEVSISPGLESGYPVLVNDHDCADRVHRVAADILGDKHVHDSGLPLAAAEDFAYFTRERPGAYFFLGAGSGTPDAPTPGCHHPDFDFDDDLLGLGMRMFMGIVTDPARA